MNTDIFFTQGTTHRICEDYAMSNKSKQAPFVVICDGCSSAPNTDFGARILAHSALPFLSANVERFNVAEFVYNILGTSFAVCRSLQLDPDCLCATFLALKVIGPKVQIIQIGDGVVAFKNDTATRILEVEFPGGAPYYARYEFNPKAKTNFENLEVKLTTTLVTAAGVEKVKSTVRSSDFLYALNSDILRPSFAKKGGLVQWDYLAVMSDGASSFTHLNTTQTGKRNELVPIEEIVIPLLEFKGSKGEFVQRRCKRAFKEFERKGWHNTDDFSIGVMALNEEA
jgi:hypothetical protein